MKTVRLPRHGEVTITVSLPLKGETCLRTNLLTKRALSRARVGDIIEIESDNLSAVETIPFMAPNHDCEHLVTMQDGGCWAIYLRRRGDANNPTPAGASQTWPLKFRKGEEE
jgi:tRNA 2-thiouridine synthesizing protein A